MCDGNTHDLVELWIGYGGNGGDTVLRWCKDCGAVAMDLDYEGRTDPGAVLKMRFPTMTYPNQRKSS